MPGPGPRGPCETYRAPCSSILDPRISARNPRKTGKSRRARGTRTRQPGTRSTRDGFSCGEIASAAGGTRPSILDPRRLLNEIRRTGLDPRAAHRPRARPSITSSTRDGLLFVKSGCKHRDPRPSRPSSRATGHRIWSEFSAKNRELAEIRQFCQNFFRIEDRVASAAERNPAHGSPAFTFCLSRWCENPSKSHTGPSKSRGGPGLSGQLDGPRSSDPRPRSAGPTRAQPVARAMFLTNNPVKNDMDVSRETLPIF